MQDLGPTKANFDKNPGNPEPETELKAKHRKELTSLKPQSLSAQAPKLRCPKACRPTLL